MFENLLAPWRAKLNIAVAQAGCYAVAGIAGAVALAFGLAALFSWLSGLYGTIAACLIIAGGFVVIALIPLIVLMSIRSREEKRVAQAAAKARATQWINPATLSLGLQAARMVSRNRGLAAGAVGALLLGWVVSQMAASHERETDAAEPAE
jgi:hypothetical protein